MQDIDHMLRAVEEAYGLILASGMPIRPVGDEAYFQSKPKMAAMRAVMLAIAKTRLGELCATDHCRNAVTEMEWLDMAFEKLRAAHPEHEMPEWDAMRCAMPSWEQVHRIYDNAPKKQESMKSKTGKQIMTALAVTGGAALILYQIKKRKKRS